MTELEEFADALLDQISVEINEEKDIASMTTRIAEDSEFTLKFDTPEEVGNKVMPELIQKIGEFTGVTPDSTIKIEFPELDELKKIKGRKVFATDDSRDFVDRLFLAIAKQERQSIASIIKENTPKFLVYSTYAKSYISKISTTYGDYLDNVIYVNNFVLSSYPKIILYKQGKPYFLRYEGVKSGYVGALKMTLLEELVHSIQKNLYDQNKQAVIEVNRINEELAKIILDLDDNTATKLSEHLQLPDVPLEFPIAKRANLFFTLNPDNFIVNVLGPDVMTYTKVEIEPGISSMVPQLHEIYQRWLGPIQRHHAVFSTMEGMAEFCVQNILAKDEDFSQYLTTFMNTDISSYQVRKHLGNDLTSSVYTNHGKNSFKFLLENPPNTRELKEPQLYLKRIK